jgi:hypothetical protein
MDTFIREAIVMFAFNKVFRAKEGFSPHGGPGSCHPYRQYLPYRVFPKGKKILPRKGEIIGIFPP